MRFLLDTNILIPLEDSKSVLNPSLANFILLANSHGHKLLYHPASEEDIERDKDVRRKEQTLSRILRYERLLNPPICPDNTKEINRNDAVDNEILYALERDAVDALITEDENIHKKAKSRGLEKRVYYIQTAEDWLKRLHSESPISLPNIQKIYLYQLNINSTFFDSLRANYVGFNEWFSRASRSGRKAWMYGEDSTEPKALCIYDIQKNQQVNDAGLILYGSALKLCTFKVGEAVRGRKIGELFLKTAFRYATDNRLENIFITAKQAEYYLINLLVDFGFEMRGKAKDDQVYIKYHPYQAPENTNIDLFEYHRKYFPHYRDDEKVRKFIVPIKPYYHKILFPDYLSTHQQLELFESHVGNAIKLAYICHAQLMNIKRGDIIMFYRSNDLKAITTLGIVEEFSILDNAEEIARLVSRRTVYSMEEIREMARKPTKVILFRLVRHFSKSIDYNWLQSNGEVNGPIQTIRNISNSAFRKISSYIC